MAYWVIFHLLHPDSAKMRAAYVALYGASPPAHFARDVEAWGQHDDWHEAGGRGPLPKMTDKAVNEIAAITARGYKKDGRRMPYESLTEMMAHSRKARLLASRATATFRTLRRLLKVKCPDVQLRWALLRWPFSPADKRARLAWAWSMYPLSDSWLSRWVAMDEFTVSGQGGAR